MLILLRPSRLCLEKDGEKVAAILLLAVLLAATVEWRGAVIVTHECQLFQWLLVGWGLDEAKTSMCKIPRGTVVSR